MCRCTRNEVCTSTSGSQAAPQRFNTTLIGLFAAIALFLSLAGLYGVMAQFVANRRYEIAVRMALGASPSEVLTSTLHRGAVLTGAARRAARMLCSRLAGLASRARADHASHSLAES